MFSTEVEEAARSHAIEAFPQESCGLVVDGEYLPCANTADKPEEDFRISSRVIAGLKEKGREVQAVIHSHPGGPDAPSGADMASQVRWNIPFAITVSGVDFASPLIWWGGDTPIEPLVGREFRHGTQDCFKLIKDYFKLVLGIDLPEFPRQDDWWNKGENLYVEGVGKAGFVQVFDDPRPHDVFFITIRSPVPNHAGVYLGNELMIHHLADKLSNEEPINRWMRHITSWWRHNSLV